MRQGTYFLSCLFTRRFTDDLPRHAGMDMDNTESSLFMYLRDKDHLGLIIFVCNYLRFIQRFGNIQMEYA